MCPVEDDYYAMTRDLVYELYGVKITRQVRRRFLREMGEARTKEQARDKAKAIHPILGDIVDRAVRQPRWKSALEVVTMVVTLLAMAPAAITNGDQAVKWVQEQLQSEKQDAQRPTEADDEENGQKQEGRRKPDQDGASDLNDGWDDIIDT